MDPYSTSISFKMARYLEDLDTDDFEATLADELNELSSEFGDSLQSVGEFWIDGDIEVTVDSCNRDGDEVTAQLSFSFEVARPSGCSNIVYHDPGSGSGSITLNVKTGEVSGEVDEARQHEDC